MQYKLLETKKSNFKDKKGRDIIYGKKGNIVEVQAIFGEIAIVKNEEGKLFSINQNQLLPIWKLQKQP